MAPSENQPNLLAQRRILSLPAAGPRLKVTTGLGTDQQRARNYFQPVVLIGSSASCHLQIASDAVCDMHVAVVNTGSRIWVTDLHTPTGALCNHDLIRCRELQDGDVLRIGPTPIHVAVRRPMGPGAGAAKPAQSAGDEVHALEWVDPSGHRTHLESAVNVVGGCTGAEIHLPSEFAVPVAALVFRSLHAWAIVPLCPDLATTLNSHPLTFLESSIVQPGDVVGFGSYRATVAFSARALKPQTDPFESRPDAHEAEPVLVGAGATAGQSLSQPDLALSASAGPASDGLSLAQRIQALRANVQTLKGLIEHRP